VAADRIREAARSGSRTSACTRIPAAPDSPSSPGSAASVGWGGSPSAPVAQEADHRVRVFERLVCSGGRHRRRERRTP